MMSEDKPFTQGGKDGQEKSGSEAEAQAKAFKESLLGEGNVEPIYTEAEHLIGRFYDALVHNPEFLRKVISESRLTPLIEKRRKSEKKYPGRTFTPHKSKVRKAKGKTTFYTYLEDANMMYLENLSIKTNYSLTFCLNRIIDELRKKNWDGITVNVGKYGQRVKRVKRKFMEDVSKP